MIRDRRTDIENIVYNIQPVVFLMNGNVPVGVRDDLGPVG
jgi:hypothetical protein